MQVEIPATYETILTGYLGTFNQTNRGVTYSVRFAMQDGTPTGVPSRNGVVVDWTATTRRLYKNGLRFLTGPQQ